MHLIPGPSPIAKAIGEGSVKGQFVLKPLAVMAKKNLQRGTKPDLFQLARQNRKLATVAEEILWDYLRSRRLLGYKFRRQQPMANYIIDFFCLEMNLAIEVDGEYHEDEKQKLYDYERTIELNALNITVLRFTNEEVINNTQEVLSKITLHLPGA